MTAAAILLLLVGGGLFLLLGLLAGVAELVVSARERRDNAAARALARAAFREEQL